jgi:hypothetical protein
VLVGDAARIAAEASAISVEWLHPSRLQHALESRPALLLSEYLDNGRCALYWYREWSETLLLSYFTTEA